MPHQCFKLDEEHKDVFFPSFSALVRTTARIHYRQRQSFLVIHSYTLPILVMHTTSNSHHTSHHYCAVDISSLILSVHLVTTSTFMCLRTTHLHGDSFIYCPHRCVVKRPTSSVDRQLSHHLEFGVCVQPNVSRSSKRKSRRLSCPICSCIFSSSVQSSSSADSVRGSYSARVPRSSSASVHREIVHHILEEEVDGQEEGQDDKREDGEQREESGVVEESQNKHMRKTHDARTTNTRLEP